MNVIGDARLKLTLALTAGSLLGGAPLLAQDTQSTSSEDAQRAAFRALHWVKGPERVHLFDNSSLEVPANYLFLNPEDAAKLRTLEHNVGSGTQYFFAPSDGRWEAWFSFRDDGYVKDQERIDADALLKSIEENTAAANAERRQRGWDEMEVVGWQTPPHYDPQTNRLEWAIKGRDKRTNDVVVNFNTRLLGRYGVMSAVLITAPDQLDAAITDFDRSLDGFEYLSGQRYAEYRPGDKVAKYGLAALVTGGAAAIAVKTGLWKVIVGALVAGWKFIVAAVVAVFGGIMRRFKRNSA